MKNTFKNRLVCILAVVLILTGLFAGCIPVRVTGSGNVIERSFDFTGFKKVRISYGFKADVKQSDTYGIKVSADDNLFDYIIVKKTGDVLYIGLKPGSYEHSQFQAAITMPSLQGIELSDGGRTTVSGFNSKDNLVVRLSDGTGLLGSLTAGNIDITLTDGSSVQLAGSANGIKIVSHDGSQSILEDFSVIDADLTIGDGGIVLITVTGTLNANLSAGSYVIYKGDPTLGNIELSSGSNLSKGD